MAVEQLRENQPFSAASRLYRGVHTRNRPLQVETADFTLKPVTPHEAANAAPSSGSQEPEGARAVCTASHRRHPGPVPGAAARRLGGASTFWRHCCSPLSRRR